MCVASDLFDAPVLSYMTICECIRAEQHINSISNEPLARMTVAKYSSMTYSTRPSNLMPSHSFDLPAAPLDNAQSSDEDAFRADPAGGKGHRRQRQPLGRGLVGSDGNNKMGALFGTAVNHPREAEPSCYDPVFSCEEGSYVTEMWQHFRPRRTQTSVRILGYLMKEEELASVVHFRCISRINR